MNRECVQLTPPVSRSVGPYRQESKWDWNSEKRAEDIGKHISPQQTPVQFSDHIVAPHVGRGGDARDS